MKKHWFKRYARRLAMPLARLRLYFRLFCALPAGNLSRTNSCLAAIFINKLQVQNMRRSCMCGERVDWALEIENDLQSKISW
jgi:hypothetical protein